MNADRSNSAGGVWHPGAAAAAWLVPGLGHALLGERQRGAVLGLTIAVLWLAGIIIGGLSVLDHRQHPAWFVGQMLMAESVAVDYLLQHHLQAQELDAAGRVAQAGHYEPSFGRIHEQGVLYTALAGLLNLLAILDVLYREPRRSAAPDGSAGSAAAPPPPPSAAALLLPVPLLAAGLAAPASLGYLPLLDPLPVEAYWLLLLPPLVLAISLAYKVIKLEDLALVPRQTLSLAGQILVFMVLAAAALWLLTEIA